ncbi:hypothetical protein FF1_031616 [Malus domestica]
MATQMTAQNPYPPRTNLTQLPSASASKSSPDPASGFTHSQTPPFLYNPNLQAAGPSSPNSYQNPWLLAAN